MYDNTMRGHITRCRVDPVLALDQFSVARPLRPEDLDRRVTRQGVYPSLPAPNGIPWSEYVRTHGIGHSLFQLLQKLLNLIMLGLLQVQ